MMHRVFFQRAALAVTTAIGLAIATSLSAAAWECKVLPMEDRHHETVEPLVKHLLSGKALSHVQGLSPAFREGLVALFASMPSEIRSEVKILSGYRSPEHQRRLWEAAVRKYRSEKAAERWVARPCRSYHNRGMALDFAFGSTRARQWVHANVKRAGIYFPLSHEPWHAEPIGSRG